MTYNHEHRSIDAQGRTVITEAWIDPELLFEARCCLTPHLRDHIDSLKIVYLAMLEPAKVLAELTAK